MSGVVKSVTKVFKKVAKVVKKVAPYALAAAAIYFTAGAALGGGIGWGATAGNAMSSLFGPGLLADTLAGAVTQAGYGALIGGAVSGITGGDISKGMLKGAIGGAITGGVSGFAGSAYTLASPTTLPTVPSVLPPPGMAPPTSLPPTVTPGPAVAPTALPPTVAGAAPVATAPAAARTGVLGFWDEIKNSELAGGLVKGVGEALLTPEAAPSGRAEAAEIAAAAETEAKRASYIGETEGGLLTKADTLASPTRPTPGQKWGYGYDPAAGKVVLA